MKKLLYPLVFVLTSFLFVFSCSTEEEETTPFPSVIATPEPEPTLESIEILNPIESLVISRRHKYEVQGTYSNGDTVDLSDLVKLEISDDRVTLLDNNEFTVGKSGDTSINITYQELETSQEFYVNYFEEVLNEFNGEYLTQNNDNAEINVPVVIINFHPTLDGLNIHPGYYPDGAGLIKWYYYAYHDLDENQCTNIDPDNPICQETTLNMYKIRAKEIEMFTKFAIEEGSKFRGYKEQNVFSNINIEIVKYFNFYELVTKNYNRGGDETDIPSPDYDNLFDLINLESLVNIDGVKEVWISLPGPFLPEYNYKLEINIPESNMSSKLTGDVSNSYRIQDDLPIYENTYLVYGMNIDRGPSESVHCRGHQIESQFRYIEENKIYGNELFWNNFVGVDNSGRPIGRCGMTHFPPNTNVDYDYCNQNLVESDIMSWTPKGGDKEQVNCSTWTSIEYDYPFETIYWNKTKGIDNIANDSGYKWFIYWFQSIPGKDNNIPYERDGNEYTLTNWWDLFYNWDDAITNQKTLWE